MQMSEDADDVDGIAGLRDFLNGSILGNDDAIDLLLVALVAGGHVLIEGPPGTGKTTLIRLLSESMGGAFRRIQFTPDLLPSDIVGCSIYDQSQSSFRFEPGPVFANMVLADELNRASPRTQSALLESMAEHQVTTDGVTRALPDPFFVAATSNELRAAGTFELPDALLDRFMLSFVMGVPPPHVQQDILDLHQGVTTDHASILLEMEQLKVHQQAVTDTTISPPVRDYIIALAQAVREHPGNLSGVSVRAILALAHSARAHAYLDGRTCVYPDDVKKLAIPVLRHRLMLHHDRTGFEHAGNVVREAIGKVPIPPRGKETT
jgi:MoxR-like ATPase